MTIGVFTTATRPYERGDNFDEAIECYQDFADEVVTMRGEDSWPQEFSWELIGQHFQEGYENCDTDWVIHADLDFFFHEKDFQKIRQACRNNSEAPALSFYKWQFVMPDRYNLKSRLVICVNKKKYGDRIKFDSGGDLCQPSLDGKELKPDMVPEAGIEFYNYEKISKNVNQVTDDVGRMARAWHRKFGEYKLGTDDEDAFNKWLEMQLGRVSKPQRHIRLEEHPIYMQGVIATLRKQQFGYDMFGANKGNDYIMEGIYA